MEKISAEVLISDQRCACVLVLDTSGSMEGEPIEQLNQGLCALEKQLKATHLSARRVEIAVVTFGNGGVKVYQNFVSAAHFIAPVLVAGDVTPMGEAVRSALRLLRNRKNEYRVQGVPYYRPWLMLITDGEPTDSAWPSAAEEVRREEERKGLTCFPIAVGAEVNLQTLSQFSSKPPVQLRGLDFESMFSWLSSSLGRISASATNESVKLLPIDTWARLA